MIKIYINKHKTNYSPLIHMTYRLSHLKQRLIRYIHPFTDKRFYKKPLMVLGFLFSLYIAYFSVMCYKCYDIIKNNMENFEITYNKDTADHVIFQCWFKGAQLPASLEILNLTIELGLGKERNSFCKLKGNDFMIRRSSDIEIYQNFRIEPNKKYKLQNLKNMISQGVKFKVSFKLRYKYRLLTYPFSKTIPFPFKPGESPVEIIKHTLEDNSVLTQARINLPYFNLTLDDFDFDIMLNKRVVGNILGQVMEKDPVKKCLMVKSTLTFDDNCIENINKGLIEIIDLDNLKLEFVNLKSKGYAENVLFNIFRSNEIDAANPDKDLKFDDFHPALDLNIIRMVGNKIHGTCDIHKSLINNFVPSELFLNKITFPDMNIDINALKSKRERKNMASLQMKNTYREDYLAFEYVMEFNDLTTFIQNSISQEGALEMVVKDDSLIGRVSKRIAFLWNYYDNFTFTSKGVIPPFAPIERQAVRERVNNFSIETFITCNSAQKFRIESKAILPKFEHRNESFRLGWNAFCFQLEFDDFVVKGRIDDSALYFHRKFDHHSDILKGTSLSIVTEIAKNETGDKARSKCALTKDKRKNTTKLPLEFRLTLYQPEQPATGDLICADVKHNFIRQQKTNSKLAVMREKILIKLKHIKSTYEVDASVEIEPIEKKPKIYNVNFYFEMPDVVILLQGVKSDKEFLKLHSESFKLVFSISDNVIYAIRPVESNTLMPISANIYWSQVDLSETNYKCKKDDKNMDYLSYFINGLLSDFLLNSLPINKICLERTTDNDMEYTDDPARMTVDLHCQKNLNVDFKFALPKSVVHQNEINSGTRMQWDHIDISLTDGQAKKTNIVMYPGDLSLQNGINHGIHQECDKFRATVEHELGFEEKDVSAIFKVGNNKHYQKIEDKMLEDIRNFFEKQGKSDKNSKFPSMQIQETKRNIESEDGIFTMEIGFNVSGDTIKFLSSKVGAVLQFFCLKKYPKNCLLNLKGEYMLETLYYKLVVKIDIDKNINMGYKSSPTDSIPVSVRIRMRTKPDPSEKDKKGADLTLLNLSTTAFSYAAGAANYCKFFRTIDFDIPYEIQFLESDVSILVKQKNNIIARIDMNDFRITDGKTRGSLKNLRLDRLNFEEDLFIYLVSKGREYFVTRTIICYDSLCLSKAGIIPKKVIRSAVSALGDKAMSWCKSLYSGAVGAISRFSL